LLQQAVKQKKPEMRMAYLTAYQISNYAGLSGRSRKPFNPLLGETYELVTPDYKHLTE